MTRLSDRSRSAKFVGDADEERLERKLRREVELLELSPRLAHELGGPLGAVQPLSARVRLELGETVDVHRRCVRADGDCDEVAVPGLELLELREQLLPLGASLRAADSLLGLTGGQLEARDVRFLDRLR